MSVAPFLFAAMVSAIVSHASGVVPDHAANDPRVVKTIDRDWTFQYFPSPDPDTDAARPDYDDSRWPAIALPHTWSTYDTTGDLHPFIRDANEREGTYWWHGWGWYRKRFALDRGYAGKLIELQFDGVQKYSRVYINGKLAGEHRGGYTSFAVDITGLVRFDGPNVLAVQVSNRRDDQFGGIPPMTAGNFDVYGGIYRDVRLVLRDRLSIPYQGSADSEGGTFVTTPDVSAERGVVHVKTWVRNSYAEAKPCVLTTTVIDAEGKVVADARTQEVIAPGATREFSQQLAPIPHPHLWSPDSPYLYRVISRVRERDRLADTYTSPLGFRWFRWDAAERRLYVNGQPLVLHGMNRHQEYPWLGDAMPKWMQIRDMEDMRRGLGMNFQRTVHYPNDPAVYDEADALGIITMEEVPNIKDIAFGRDIQHANLKEAIRRDRNHPSIFIWSIGNETNQPADSAWAKDEDTTRIIFLRRGENGGDFVQMTDDDVAIENLLRCTVRGWYTNDDHKFSAETINPSSGQVTGTELWQHDRDTHTENLATNNVVVWIYADHGADRKYVNSPLLYINPKGFVDAYRFPKFAYYLWQANFTKKAMAYILPAYWREQYVGQRKPIIVDSNLDDVRLKVNGKTIGTAHPSDANNHSVTFDDVEIERGTVSVEARSVSGDQHAAFALTMAGRAARLVLSSSAMSVTADRAGIAVLSADIVDAQGVHVYGAHPPLTWSVSGPARWLGPSEFTSDTDKNGSHDGTMYIDAPVSNLLRSTDTPGEIRVSVSAPGLESAELVLHARAAEDDSVPGVTEPRLSDAGRGRVTRARESTSTAATNGASLAIAELDKDYELHARSREETRAQLERFVRERNPKLDTNTAAWRAFADRMTTLIMERGGQLIADDYNFLARQHGKRSAETANASGNATANASASADDRDEARRRIRAALFVPDVLPALDAETYGQVEPAPNVVADRVSYATAYGLRVPAIVYHPKHAPRTPGKLPAIVVVNGHGGDKYTWYAYYAGLLYAQAGAVVLTYDPIGEGERNLDRKDGTRQHDRHIAAPEPEMAQRMGGLMMTDVMQAVSYLASRPDVDPQRIAAVGYSMGSFVLSLACAADTRLNACVLAGGGNLDGPGGYWDSSNKEMCQAIPYKSLLFLGDRGARLYDLHADRGATLILNGDADDVVAMPTIGGAAFFEDLRKRTIALHGSDRQVFEFQFTPGGGHRPYFLTRPAALFLEQHLHFPNWTAESISKMPTTHISEWARRHHVEIDKLYATELREGGTEALGTGLPAVAHDLMDALPRDRWEKDKDKYVYETWVTNARAKAAQGSQQ